jgi:hypothetical protein
MPKKKLTWKEKMLFLFPLALLAAPLVLGERRAPTWLAGIDPRGDAMDRAMRRRVGYAQDCGFVPLRGNRASADACATAAFKQNRPFTVRYREVVSYADREPEWIRDFGIAGTAQGQVYLYEDIPTIPKGEFSEQLCPYPEGLSALSKR